LASPSSPPRASCVSRASTGLGPPSRSPSGSRSSAALLRAEPWWSSATTRAPPPTRCLRAAPPWWSRSATTSAPPAASAPTRARDCRRRWIRCCLPPSATFASGTWWGPSRSAFGPLCHLPRTLSHLAPLRRPRGPTSSRRLTRCAACHERGLQKQPRPSWCGRARMAASGRRQPWACCCPRADGASPSSCLNLTRASSRRPSRVSPKCRVCPILLYT